VAIVLFDLFIDLEVDFENTMYFDGVQDATVCLKNESLVGIISILYDLFFKIDVFLPCDKMSQEVLQPLES
jgi:hypothetical protein